MRALRSRRSLPLVAAFDLLTCLLLVFVISVGKPKAQPPHIVTFGVYAVVMDWPRSHPDDMDLYVQDPAGNIIYYASPNGGLMNLEHDDIPLTTEVQMSEQAGGRVSVPGDYHERSVLRGTIPGEYTVNVHVFQRHSTAPTAVTISLWQLSGADHVIHTQVLHMGGTGDEQTAFRFEVNSVGHITGYTRLPKKFVGSAPSPGAYNQFSQFGQGGP